MPNITVSRQLVLSMVGGSGWYPLLNLSTQAPYYCALNGRALVNSIRFQNQDAGAISIEVAVSPIDSGITSSRTILGATVIAGGETFSLGECVVVPGSHAVWVRASSGTANLIITAPCLEYVIGAVEPQIQVPNTTVPYVAESWVDVGTVDLTGYLVVMVKTNRSGDPGVYFYELTEDEADGANIVADLVGNKFRLYR